MGMIRRVLICFFCAVAPLPVFSASELTFDYSAKPATLVLGGVNRFASNSSSGFHLRYFDGKDLTDTLLSDIATTGDEITVSHPNGLPRFTFRIDSFANHLAIHLIDVQGIGTDRNWGLSLELRANADVGHFPLNGMADSTGRDWPYGISDQIDLNWPYLWAARGDGTRGSFVLYDGILAGEELDATLTEIWSTQNAAGHMVRPAGQTTWTTNDVLAWVAQYEAKFASLSTVSVAPGNEQELYEMTDTYVIPSGAKRVYMFSTIWRGEYHLDYLGMADVNTNVFPNGKADLIAYGSYLATNGPPPFGAHLQLKSLSPGIGQWDPRFVSSSFVDPRIATWGTGRLEDAVNSSATTLRLRPDPGVTVPLRGSNPHVGGRMEYQYCRVGPANNAELIKVGKFTRTDDEVWMLEDCSRGYGATDPKSHSASSEMAGYHLANDMFIPALDLGETNSISEEICDEYADFLDDVNVGHIHHDGAAQMQLTPWHDRDIFDYIYSRVDHPTTSSRVGESTAANFEQLFSGVRDNKSLDYNDVRIGLRLHDEGNSHIETSTSMLDLHFDALDGIMNNSRRPSFAAGKSGGALTMDILNHYGMTGEAFQLFKDWIELAPVFDDADASYVSGFMSADGNHWKGEDVLVLGTNGTGGYIFTPHRVMGRTSGEDEFIHIDQEWGAVPRFQDIPAGTTMQLYNPYAAQTPQVVVRVEEGSPALEDPLITINGTGTLDVSGDIQPGEYMKYEGGSTVRVYDGNWNFGRTLSATATSFTVNSGNNDVTTDKGSGSNTPDLRVQYITLGDVYVLESNNNL
ncbi:hypothetical protein [Pontiella desulfatans]|nr:hypothetical protein [Pontiella desulfatans]